MRYKAYKLLMILQGILWFILTILGIFTGTVSQPVLLLLMALDGTAYILLALFDLQKPLFKLAVPVFLVANTILTVTDQMGFMDVLVLGWNLILLGLAFFIIFEKHPN